MDKKAWKKKIKEQCEAVGTFNKAFLPVIDTLADTLEQRDLVYKAFLDSGGEPIVEHTNKAGATNIVKNPALVLWDDLNKSALAYWRDLGLTPSGLKKIDEKALKPKKKDALAEALKAIG